MKKHLGYVFAALIALASSNVVKAEATQHEIFANTTDSTLQFGSNGGNTVFQLNAGYSYKVTDMIQATGILGTQFTSGNTQLGLLVGPTFNFALGSGKLNDAVYLTAVAGIAYVNTTASSTDFRWVAEIGKRFALAENVTWKPAFRADHTVISGVSPTFSVVPVQFSFFL